MSTSSSGRAFALNSAGRLWSADAQALALGTAPHFVASCFQLKTSAIDSESLTFEGVTAHPKGQYVVVHASQVRTGYKC